MKKKRFIAIRNQADNTLELYFLDIIEDTYDWFMGWTSKVQEVIDKVNYYKPSKIKVVIDSEGGDAQTGMSIYNFLKRCEAKVEVEIIGLAGSIASVIAMAANKGKLRIAKNAFIMIHKAEGACWGTGDELRKGADIVDMYTAQIADIYAQRTGKSIEEINSMISDGDFWMTGEEAVANGFADETFNETPNLQIAARLDMSQYKHVPAQIRAQLKPEQTDDKSFIQNQFDQMKKFFTDIVNAMRGTKPATDANPQTIVTNLADAIQKPMETLGDEIDKTIDEKVNKATGEELITKITNKIKETSPAATVVDFTAEGPKNALDTAVKTAVDAATKNLNDKITNLETINGDLKKKNDELEKDVTNMKGGRSNAQNNGAGRQSIGRFS